MNRTGSGISRAFGMMIPSASRTKAVNGSDSISRAKLKANIRSSCIVGIE